MEQKEKNEWVSWGLIVFLFIIGAEPISFLLLLMKLFGKDEPKKSGSKEPVGKESSKETGSKAKRAVKKVTRTPKLKKRNTLWLKIVGGMLALAGLLTLSESVGLMIASYGGVAAWLEDLVMSVVLLLGGGAMVGKGLLMDRALQRYSRYLSVMGDRESITLRELSRALGYSERQVRGDLEKMIDNGYFGGRAYLNVELGRLFRTAQAEAEHREEQRQARAAAEQPKEREQGYSGILRQIRAANDRIADPALSAKIDRLEEITARIFRAMEEDPRKKGQMTTFLEYYLPTTQKLLNSYASFEQAGVEGENLRQAKQRIETTMDMILRGFEHQLDELYRDDAMDIEGELRAMETMLRRDTASVEEDFELGGTAVQWDKE